MRICCLLSCLLLFTVTLSAQKIGFGISVKAGNFTLPKKGPGPRLAGYTYSENALSAGMSAGFGACAALDLNRRWGLRAEALYGVAFFDLRETYNFDPQFEQYMLFEIDQTREFQEHYLLIPLKVYLKLGASRKTVLACGVTPSLLMYGSEDTPEISGLIRSRMFYPNGEAAKPAPSAQLLYALSVHRRLDARTSIGLECSLSANRNRMDIYFYDYKWPIPVYEPADFPSGSPFSMKSLSVSLIHLLWL